MFTQKDVKRQLRTPASAVSAGYDSSIPSAAVPNSAMVGIHGTPDVASPGLADAMQSRFSNFMNNQIGAAEREADRIAASVSSTASVDEVKAHVGERMGADFSGVRFHEGGSDEAMATGIGARAYTVGNDVYFGAGGFDPQIAAHELTHTVQQGAVEGTASTSAPMGTVQMAPFDFIKKFFGGGKGKNKEKAKSTKNNPPAQTAKVPKSVLNPPPEKRKMKPLTGDGALFSAALDKMEPAAQADQLQRMRLYLQEKEDDRQKGGRDSKLSERDASLKLAYDQSLYKYGKNGDFRKALLDQTHKSAVAFEDKRLNTYSDKARKNILREYAVGHDLTQYVSEWGYFEDSTPGNHEKIVHDMYTRAEYEGVGLSDEAFDLEMYLGLLDDVSGSMDKGVDKTMFDIDRDYAKTINKTEDSDESFEKQVSSGYHSMRNARRTDLQGKNDQREKIFRSAKNLRYKPAGLEKPSVQRERADWKSPKRKERKWK